MSVFLAFVLGLVFTPLAAHVGRTLGLVDEPSGDGLEDGLKIHGDPTPVLGGLAVIVSTFVVVLGWLGSVPTSAIAAVMISFTVGLVDDVRGLSPGSRVVALAVAGTVLTGGGFDIGSLGSLGAAGTVLLVLACANAVNLVDGQDGLAGGLTAVAAAGLAALAESSPGLGPVLGWSLAGALAGFVVWNLSSYRVFLGNSGAYAVGTALAAVAAANTRRGEWGLVAAGGICLGVLAFEMVFTVVRRVRAGGLLTGDRAHTYDLLAARGLGRRRVTVCFWGIGTAFSAVAVLLIKLQPGGAPAVLIGLLAVAAVAGIRVGSSMRRTVKQGPRGRRGTP